MITPVQPSQHPKTHSEFSSYKSYNCEGRDWLIHPSILLQQVTNHNTSTKQRNKEVHRHNWIMVGCECSQFAKDGAGIDRHGCSSSGSSSQNKTPGINGYPIHCISRTQSQNVLRCPLILKLGSKIWGFMNTQLRFPQSTKISTMWRS